MARVRRDEEAAGVAEAEERKGRMKDKIATMKGEETKKEDDTIYDPRGNVNLFRREELAEAARTGGLTEEEAKVRDAKEYREKRKLGLFANRVPIRNPPEPWFAAPRKRTFEEMREKRLERERSEAKRAARVLKSKR